MCVCVRIYMCVCACDCAEVCEGAFATLVFGVIFMLCTYQSIQVALNYLSLDKPYDANHSQ